MIAADVYALFITNMIDDKNFEFDRTVKIKKEDFIKTSSLMEVFNYGEDVFMAAFEVDEKKWIGKDSFIHKLYFDGSYFSANICIFDISQLARVSKFVEENADNKLIRRNLQGEASLAYIIYNFHKKFPPHVCAELKTIASFAVDLVQDKKSGVEATTQGLYDEIMALGELLKGDD